MIEQSMAAMALMGVLNDRRDDRTRALRHALQRYLFDYEGVVIGGQTPKPSLYAFDEDWGRALLIADREPAFDRIIGSDLGRFKLFIPIEPEPGAPTSVLCATCPLAAKP